VSFYIKRALEKIKQLLGKEICRRVLGDIFRDILRNILRDISRDILKDNQN